MRTARSQRLEASLADDAVTAATFTGGDVTFEETGLKGVRSAGRLPAAERHAEAFRSDEGGHPDGRGRAGRDRRTDHRRGARYTKMTARGRDASDDVHALDDGGVSGASRRRSGHNRSRARSNVPRLLKSDAPITIVAARPAALTGRKDDSQKATRDYTRPGNARAGRHVDHGGHGSSSIRRRGTSQPPETPSSR